MLQTNTKTLAKLFNINCGTNVEFSGIYTDTRQRMDGGVFLALIGDNFDAHNYIQKAEEMGAVAIIASRQVSSRLPVLLVKNTQDALSKIAKHHLNNIKPMAVAITGSNGKTTTKNLLANILKLSAPTLKTAGNLNNHLGVPMTLLKLEPTHQYAVIEMGANHLGEIKHLRELVQPDVAVVTNTGDAHIGEFGSKENLISAKGEIYSVDSQNITNTNTNYTADLSFGNDGDVFASNIHESNFTLNIKEENIDVSLQLIGKHNIDNALAASACAHALGIDIDQIKLGLENTKAESGRLNTIRTEKFTLIDDTYNASPTSVKAALETLSQYRGELVVILGDMAELGDEAISLHQQVGKLAKQITANFYSFGTLSKHYQAQHFDSQQQLSDHIIKNHLDSTVLVKGSRIAQLDKLITLLQK
ncbi:UDP-N-acetylmuramoyl-tripeptide--D-alanyl-D-alanine ligase [uncultured Candidatus Thioglobus sp.]|jgi:UDP-N-acetylmuramoyl-tripeptide--D-alanyl-D-alanine ligase|uniref:UDP-N-acetylmuramoyl-tripeptide--D-alanyl-D- alanine ligase n=1 Tax=uncultured Candidatus Thioglobus sp. TaxID=655186 RepID=UPI001DFE12BE|nr:UDP-N-acetylmuramoyl-tripeptide--D-alanyl-D-alanine ligase [Candidatus Thioglobus sp.]MBT5164394.1 UDP-N-acetylmuramoyl-tripeptide--D-alanyl-D-alanine ligase [Candidatus Thioglobus sp.]MBT6752595.1 UDP-N-acetylmuramoyl-tripeptide--D-alanyl-D-alanine ligase [Candidatus Thioglobus sp.]MBT7839990.1 UDP-N-acetylmuramoyl-tripeptide--D-alanyl-D-alanine ligase [Candidatus Thioglobus sp.]